MLDDSKPISITVNLPISGYVPSQMISFSAKIKNDSDVNVAEIRFKLVQVGTLDFSETRFFVLMFF